MSLLKQRSFAVPNDTEYPFSIGIKTVVFYCVEEFRARHQEIKTGRFHHEACGVIRFQINQLYGVTSFLAPKPTQFSPPLRAAGHVLAVSSVHRGCGQSKLLGECGSASIGNYCPLSRAPRQRRHSTKDSGCPGIYAAQTVEPMSHRPFDPFTYAIC